MADSPPSIFSSSSSSSSSSSPATADSLPSIFNSTLHSSSSSSSLFSFTAMSDTQPSIFSSHTCSSSSTATADSQPLIFGTVSYSSSSTAMAGSRPLVFSSKSSSSASRAQWKKKTRRMSNQTTIYPNSFDLISSKLNENSIPTFSAKPTSIELPTFSSGIKSYITNAELEKDSNLPLIVVSRILNGIPQSPHFYQFRNLSRQTRESLISALDRVFEETVKQLYALQVLDFWPKAKVLWKTMEDLQGMGYNVIVLRRRLVELLDVTVELRLAKMKIKELKIKAEDHRMEKSRLENIFLNVQKMAEAEQERMQQLLTEAAKKEDELPNFDAEFVKLTMKPL